MNARVFCRYEQSDVTYRPSKVDDAARTEARGVRGRLDEDRRVPRPGAGPRAGGRERSHRIFLQIDRLEARDGLTARESAKDEEMAADAGGRVPRARQGPVVGRGDPDFLPGVRDGVVGGGVRAGVHGAEGLEGLVHGAGLETTQGLACGGLWREEAAGMIFFVDRERWGTWKEA